LKHLVRVLFASMLAVSAVAGLTVTSMATASSGHPLPPVGFKANPAPPPEATLKVTMITLSIAECAAMNTAVVAAGKPAVASCLAELQSYGQNRLALPAGTRTAAARSLLPSSVVYAAAAYWYWSRWDKACSIYGCWFWSTTLQEDGVANGTNVWEWNIYCTPTGYNTNITWCGFSHNGGGWPYYSIQFGLNSQSCTFYSGGPACSGHGIRVSIDDWGNAFGRSAW
jgi:hypothetical protein